jgi:tetratricopeptide (TPR) repeat protein
MESLLVEGIDEVIEEQFKRLSEPERGLLCRISVFREAVPFEALMALSEGILEKEIRELTKKLRRRSLLTHAFLNEVETYDLHPMVEEYAYEKLEDKINAHRLAYNYYTSLKLKPREKRRTLADVQSLVEAHFHACSGGEYDKAVEVIKNNYLHEDLALWGYSRVLIELYERLLPEDWKSGGRRLSEPRNNGIVIGNLGEAYRELGEVNKAISYYEQALRISREIGDKRNEGLWLYNLGVTYKDQESNKLALACFLMSAKIRKEIEDPELSYTNGVIKDMRQTLGEEEFTKLKAKVQANLAKYLKEATGIEGWEV